MHAPLAITPRRMHLTRLMAIWRSAGWPCRDAVELDLVAAGWATIVGDAGGHETIRLTDAGIRLLADSRQRNQRSLSVHDQLAGRVAAHLKDAGRLVWRELSLRARITTDDPTIASAALMTDEALWTDDQSISQPPPQGNASWRMARPDVFSVRRTTVEDYLQPMVHEVKVSRADLLSDLRHSAKRESYQWLSCETYFVLPAGVAEPQEIPEAFGVWLLNGSIDDGALELARPARHLTCKLPFAVWMALAKAAPVSLGGEDRQGDLGEATTPCAGIDDEAIAFPSQR
ncbi:MAG: hypothetical protein K2Y02_00640 [Burkholderiaceae bacterium]|nr:hypothetical protein [Burkholderiaceae bacterium]